MGYFRPEIDIARLVNKHLWNKLVDEPRPLTERCAYWLFDLNMSGFFAFADANLVTAWRKIGPTLIENLNERRRLGLARWHLVEPSKATRQDENITDADNHSSDAEQQ